mgnify:CR=1 FL=1
MISFVQFLILSEDLPKEANDIIKQTPDKMKAILKFIRLQKEKGTDLGGKLEVRGAAHTREFGMEHDALHGSKKKEKVKA